MSSYGGSSAGGESEDNENSTDSSADSKAGLIKCLQSYQKVNNTRWTDDTLLRHASYYI